MPIVVNPIEVVTELFELVITIWREVRDAKSKASEGGRKITGREWRRICSRAGAQLAISLTDLFASDLDDDALATFSDSPPSRAA